MWLVSIATSLQQKMNPLLIVKTIQVPKDKQKIIADTSIKALGKTKQTKTTQNHFSPKEKQAIINENYQKVLNNYPSRLPDQAKQAIHGKVETQVQAKLQTINQQINKAISAIKTYAKGRYTKAFTGLYRYSICFIGLAVFTFLLFPEKKNRKLG